MFDRLEIPHKFFQNWIILCMLGIRDCVPLMTALLYAFIFSDHEHSAITINP